MAASFSISAPAGATHSCNCIGPQNGEPRCPCMMRGLIQRDGRWIEPERDLGPVRKSDVWTFTHDLDLTGSLADATPKSSNPPTPEEQT